MWPEYSPKEPDGQFHIAGSAAFSRMSPQMLPRLKQMQNGRH
jgi:hypothetical protein